MPDQQDARYLYCVVPGRYAGSARPIGIEGKPVYDIAFKGISAVVHACAPVPYQSKDVKKIHEWALAHDRVVGSCFEKLLTVVPIAFDTIVKGGDEEVRLWLRDDYDRLNERLRRLHLKAEYGIQVFWDPEGLGASILRNDPRIRRWVRKRDSSLNGLAYIWIKKAEQGLAHQLRTTAEKRAQEIYSMIAEAVEDVCAAPTKGISRKRMLVNLSILVARGKEGSIRQVLAKIASDHGVQVRLAGPWPPYSFA